MKKLSLLTLFCLLFCTLFLTACGSKSTKENGDADIEKKIIGKWMQTEIDGKPAATNDKTVTTFQSSTKAIGSSSRDNYNKDSAKWSVNREYDVKIDGKKVKPSIILDSLIGIEVSEGQHEISLKYKNNDYIGAAFLSLATLIGYISFNIKRRKQNEVH